MGRPVNDKFFGDPALDGKQIQVEAWFTGASSVSTAYVVRQRSSYQYEVTDGTFTEVMTLSNGMPMAEGEAALIVSPYGSSDEYAYVLHNRTVKTHQGNIYNWSVDAAEEEGEADLAMA
jgi:hypothetical protein